MVRGGLDCHPAGNLAHGCEKGKAQIGGLHGFIRNRVDVPVHEKLGECTVSGEMEVGKQLLPFAEAVIFARNRLLYLHNEIRCTEDGIGVSHDGGTCLGELPIAKSGSLARAGLDKHRVAAARQFGDPIGLHGDAVLVVLDLCRDPNCQGCCHGADSFDVAAWFVPFFFHPDDLSNGYRPTPDRC